jgi:hypothetical protein
VQTAGKKWQQYFSTFISFGRFNIHLFGLLGMQRGLSSFWIANLLMWANSKDTIFCADEQDLIPQHPK